MIGNRGNSVDLQRELKILRPVLMFTFTAFVVLSGALIGGVWWVCRNDSDAR